MMSSGGSFLQDDFDNGGAINQSFALWRLRESRTFQFPYLGSAIFRLSGLFNRGFIFLVRRALLDVLESMLATLVYRGLAWRLGQVRQGWSGEPLVSPHWLD